MSNTSYRIIGYHQDEPGLYLISTESLGNTNALENTKEMAQVRFIATTIAHRCYQGSVLLDERLTLMNVAWKRMYL